MSRTLRLLALPFVFIPAFLAAQDEDLCDATRTQLDMYRCAALELAEADSVLNTVWQQVIGEMDPERAPLLRQAQREWIQLRDAECAFERAQFEGGSMAPMVHSFCMTMRTRERTAYLRRVLPDSQGDRQRAEVIDAAYRLFQAMRDRDASVLAELLHPRAIVAGIAPGGETQVRTAPEWLRMVAESREVLDEQMWDARVQIDGDLATLWAPYDFRRDGRFSHCGTDAFQFVRQNGAWRLIAVTFTRRTTPCDARGF
ncbi:MAG TPA: lysozyme inhibitor LprI family protein [Longimicrobium sp.]|nr:lysozyme inhibitor LprI family protein [Longimicrobium sp.]